MKNLLTAAHRFMFMRALLLFLSLIMLLTCAPLTVFSVESDRDSVTVSPETKTASPDGSTYDYDTLKITLDGKEISSLSIYNYEKITVRAQGIAEQADYQWQIRHPERSDFWVDIYDGTSDTINVTYALVNSALSEDGTAALRCRAYTSDYAYLTSNVTVTLRHDEPAESPVPAAEKSLLAAAPGSSADTSEGVSDAITPEFVTVTVNYEKYEYHFNADLREYELQYKGTAFSPYVATLRYGSSFPSDSSVSVPAIVGFEPRLVEQEGATMADGKIGISLSSITSDVVYTVQYLPAPVDYEVRYLFQNIYDDMYVTDTAVNDPDLGIADGIYKGKGYTGLPPYYSVDDKGNLIKDADAKKGVYAEFHGFTALYYQPDTIAADGSTVFEVYYERNYYLMEFDCDGGYGAYTLYVRHGTYIYVPSPAKAGYVFNADDNGNCWDLVKSEDPSWESKTEEELRALLGERIYDAKGSFTGFYEGNGTPDALPAVMPAYNSAYKILWKTAAATYTVVYWRENADDNDYSYWGSAIIGADADGNPDGSVLSATTVSGSDNVPASVSNATVDGAIVDEKVYFTYNDALTDKNVLVEGNGSAIVNVYYDRKEFTVRFQTGSNTFNVPNGEHDHLSDCYCGYEHIHGDECGGVLICTAPEHKEHYPECLTCITPEHIHDDSCALCGKEAHSHNTACCVLAEHSHTVACYTLTNASFGNQVTEDWIIEWLEAQADSSETGIVRLGWDAYYKVSDKWYRINVNNWNNVSITLNCTQTVHAHGDGNCTCAKETHTHAASCYLCGSDEHTHTDPCMSCGKPEHTHAGSCYSDSLHTHADSCYKWSCGEEEHLHSEACCTKPMYYITGTDSNSEYIITAKYDQTVGDIWPTAADFPDIRFYGWDIDAVEAMAVSKRVNMTSDLCDTSDNTKNAELETTTESKKYLYYMFESFDQTAPANGNERIKYGNTYYDKSELYYQEVYAGNSFGLKEITGMSPVTKDAIRSGSNFFLYYTRNSNNLYFHNVNKVIDSATQTGLKFGYPLKDITVNGVPASDLIPPYPETYEPGAYEFGGWYTTPECFPGTEADWDKMSMPNSEYTLYAKWTPVVRNVYFHRLYTDVNYDDVTKGTFWYPDGITEEEKNDYYPIKVSHGESLGTTYSHIPSREGDYRFIGWFYFDENGKKKFAPDSMKVDRDLILFAEWHSSIVTKYKVEYQAYNYVDGGERDELIDSEIGTALDDYSTAGKTITFNAKGEKALYDKSGWDTEPTKKNNYQSGWFPESSSHSILMEQESANNTYIFKYYKKEYVNYKVMYINRINGEILGESEVRKTYNAIVTERFKPFENFIPEEYYIEHPVAYDSTEYVGENEFYVSEENIIYFYYVPDIGHALYRVDHYQQNVDNDDYTLYKVEQGPHDINKEKTAAALDEKGFELVKIVIRTYSLSNDNATWVPKEEEFNKPDKNADGTLIAEWESFLKDGVTGLVTLGGLEIEFYYDRLEYPYTVNYVEDVNNNNILHTESGTARYGSAVFHTAPGEYENIGDANDDGLVYIYQEGADASEEQRTKTRQITEDKAKNILNFVYTKKKLLVQYHAVCTVPSLAYLNGVSVSGEMVASANELMGCEAMPGTGFRFKGWFRDEACTVGVDTAWVIGNKLKPGELADNDGNKDDTVHYYALFEPLYGALTINKFAASGTDLTGSNFMFRIVGNSNANKHIDLVVSINGEGSVTVNKLPVGDYTVTELTSWSWEYDLKSAPAENKVEVEQDKTSSASFTNEKNGKNWLGGESHTDNIFK